MAHKICGARSERGQLRPAVDAPEKMGMQRPRFALVIMRKEFGAISGDIHVGGAFRFTRLAGKAKIERLFYVFIFPGNPNPLPLQELKKDGGPPGSAVVFLER